MPYKVSALLFLPFKTILNNKQKFDEGYFNKGVGAFKVSALIFPTL